VEILLISVLVEVFGDLLVLVGLYCTLATPPTPTQISYHPSPKATALST